MEAVLRSTDVSVAVGAAHNMGWLLAVLDEIRPTAALWRAYIALKRLYVGTLVNVR